jgi:hypothetical protein
MELKVLTAVNSNHDLLGSNSNVLKQETHDHTAVTNQGPTLQPNNHAINQSINRSSKQSPS